MPNSSAMAIEGVYINLERSSARRARFEVGLAAHRLPYPITRFAALDGEGRPDRPQGLTPGQHGCKLSHLGALAAAATSPAHLHVIEDDALFGAGLRLLPAALEKIEQLSGGDWDLVYLDATVVELPDMCAIYEQAKLQRASGSLGVMRVDPALTLYGALSYVVNGRRKQAVHALVSDPRTAGRAIDNIYCKAVRAEKLRAYLVVPFITSSTDEAVESTIANSPDRRQAVWQAFRRLCFHGVTVGMVREIEALASTLGGEMSPADRVFGKLCAHRMTHGAGQRFRGRL